jgi:hypothetical protein
MSTTSHVVSGNRGIRRLSGRHSPANSRSLLHLERTPATPTLATIYDDKLKVPESAHSDAGSIFSFASSQVSSASSASRRSYSSSIFSRTSSRLSTASSVFSVQRWKRARSSVSKPAVYARIVTYWCVDCESSFTNKQKWREHEDERHPKLEKYVCPEPGCCKTFWELVDFSHHHHDAHVCDACPHSKAEIRYLGSRKRWSCGFCSLLHESHESHLEHLADHYESGKTLDDWSHSRVIFGLLQQTLVRDAWNFLAAGKLGSPGSRPTSFTWYQGTTGRAEVYGDYGRAGQLQDFLEHFCGVATDAVVLAQLAFDGVNVGIWNPYTQSSAFENLGIDHSPSSAALREFYSSKPLPPLPAKRFAISKSRFSRGKGSLPQHGVRRTSLGRVEGGQAGEMTNYAWPLAHRAKSSQVNPELPNIRVDDFHNQLVSRLLKQEDNTIRPQSRFSEDEESEEELDISKSTSSISDDEDSTESQSVDDEAMETSADVLAEDAMNSSFDLMIERVMEEFWTMWNQEWDMPIRQRISGSSSSSGSTSQGWACSNMNTNSVISNFSRTTGKRARSDDDFPSEENNNDGSKEPSGGSASKTTLPIGKKFACPFRKHDPVRYSLAARKVCASSGWDTTHRVK